MLKNELSIQCDLIISTVHGPFTNRKQYFPPPSSMVIINHNNILQQKRNIKQNVVMYETRSYKINKEENKEL